jgi:hypothetical protein
LKEHLAGLAIEYAGATARGIPSHWIGNPVARDMDEDEMAFLCWLCVGLEQSY